MKKAGTVGFAIMVMAAGSLGACRVDSIHQEVDEAKIKGEVVAHLKRFAGPVADQSVELWDQYFLNSPNIGNLHGPDVEIGWEAFHQGNISFFSSAGIEGGSFDVDDIRVYPINENVAWVRGLFISNFGGATDSSVFYDTLVRTEEGWRVVLSYVEPPSRAG
jgi:hypothetical protein